MLKSAWCNYSGEARVRWRVLMSNEANPERKVFAALELFCFPVSLITLFVLLPGQIVAARCGVETPVWCLRILTVMLAAALGYITNYIALEMLFKPYRKTGRHPLTWLSFGYWKQGMIPKNKNRIGAEFGRQIETRLLDPEKLADDLCNLASDAMRGPELIGKIRDSAQAMLREHEQKIISSRSNFFRPTPHHLISDVMKRSGRIISTVLRKFTNFPVIFTPNSPSNS